MQRGCDPLAPHLDDCLEFLTSRVFSQKVRLTVLLMSMLSATLPKLEGFEVGKHPLIMELMKGIYNERPPQPRYTHTWDLNRVLRHLSLKNREQMSLKELAGWTALLLALAAFIRVAELASMVRRSIRFTSSIMSWSLSPRKAQHAGALRGFEI